VPRRSITAGVPAKSSFLVSSSIVSEINSEGFFVFLSLWETKTYSDSSFDYPYVSRTYRMKTIKPMVLSPPNIKNMPVGVRSLISL